jgi:RNA polymerase sigma-70 factor (ECF subfamily)
VAGPGTFDSFYATSYDRILGQVVLVLGDLEESEDVVQDAFARASVRWSRIARYDAPEAWVRRVALNQAASSLRRGRRRLRALARLGGPVNAPALSADSVDLLRALRRLPLGQREVLVLHYLVELPLDQVASQLGVPLGTVKSRLARGRSALARHLGMEEVAPDVPHA